jgi:hypothetical protein
VAWAVSCMVRQSVFGFVAGFKWGFPSLLKGTPRAVRDRQRPWRTHAGCRSGRALLRLPHCSAPLRVGSALATMTFATASSSPAFPSHAPAVATRD